MSTQLSKAEEIKKKFRDLTTSKSSEELIKHDAYILMSGYLSEIDRIQDVHNFNRTDLAKKIEVSPSYLTQVFRGNKPLNFFTLAKIQKALGIKFKVTAHSDVELGYVSYYSVNPKNCLKNIKNITIDLSSLVSVHSDEVDTKESSRYVSISPNKKIVNG